jgi:hypothetical protein
MAMKFVVNGRVVSTDAPASTPLLWVIREDLKLTGTKFGCGQGLCGACMVHIDGKRKFSWPDPGFGGEWPQRDHDRGPLRRQQPSVAEGLGRRARGRSAATANPGKS